MQILAQYEVHIWAVIILVGSGLIGYLWHRLSRTSAHLRTFVFSVGFPNWIYLPLAIAGPIWGDEAVRLLILFNIPTQVLLWTAGIWVLGGSMRGAHAVRFLLLNPGILSSAAGLVVAFDLLPVTFKPGGPGWSLAAISAPLHMIGGLTIPLSIVALGLYLGERTERRVGEKREVFVTTIGRLLIAPILLGAVLLGATAAGFPTPEKTRWILYLIMSMPVAVSAPLFARMFNGDRMLAARAVVFSTMAGLFTSPLFVLAAIKLETLLGLSGPVAGP